MGHLGSVEDHTFAELQQWPLLQHNQEAVIPSFASVVKALPNARFNVEIKANNKAVVVALWELINTYGLYERIQVSSFHHEVLVAFRQISDNRIPTGASPQEVLEFLLLWNLGKEAPMAFASLQLPYGGSTWLDAQIASLVKIESSPRIQIFTVNSVEKIEPLLGKRSFGVMTDVPSSFIAEQKQTCRK